jgi:superoxide dismutase, Cu-Zn family
LQRINTELIKQVSSLAPNAEGRYRGHMGNKTIVVVLATAATVLGTAGTALAGSTPPAHPADTSADFELYQPHAKAVTYNPDLVPVGAHVTVLSTPRHGKTTVRLNVKGLLPNHMYGAHVHQKPCGPTGNDAGPHFQNVVDPVQPSVDPAYANPRNEIWLDPMTDGDGESDTSSTVNWQFTDRHAGSVVIHTEHTHTDPGNAGTAGARLACINVDF